MASGYNLDTTADVGYFDDLVLAPGSESVWWFTWDFDSRHFQRLAFTAVSPGRVTIVSEWTTHEIHNTRRETRAVTTLWARLRNDGDLPVTVRPSVLLAPTRYRR